MLTERLEGWLEILSKGEDGGEWVRQLCVFFVKEKNIRTFLDKEAYLDYVRFVAATAKIRAKLGGDSPDVGKKEGFHPLGRRSRRGRSDAGDGIGALHRLGDKIAGGIRSRTRSVLISGPVLENIGNFHQEPGISRWRSHDSLLQDQMKSSMDSVDLSFTGQVSVRAIHPSILSRQHCFQVTTPQETKYFSCRSAEELEKWVVSIKRSIQPSRDLQYRTDIGLSVWIVEAKGLTSKPKKRYFCELLFDKVLYARTSTKAKSDILFWGENFAFNDLPELGTVTVQIYKENETKTKKDKRKLVGTVDVSVESLEIGQDVEKWYPITMATKKENNGDASVRLKFRYQKVSILPIKCYSELQEFLIKNYMLVCSTLEPVVNAKLKDEISRAYLRILQACGKAKEFLASIVMAEVSTLENENLVFRGNSFATKAMDTYMKMVGEWYLQETLGVFVNSVYEFQEDCEVDPSRVTCGTIEGNQENLFAFVEKAWNHILCSSCHLPSDLKATFHEFRIRCAGASNDMSSKLISGSIFLRFLCPAVLSPSLFSLVQEYPNERTSRTLTLIAKVLQNLANFTRFGGKEEYMGFMNNFVEREFGNMRQFLTSVSSPSAVVENQYDGIIDTGRELATIFNILLEQTSKLNQDALEKLRSLQFILKSLQEIYLDADKEFFEERRQTQLHRKWASSSDLISDRQKDGITLTPVSQIKISKQLPERTRPEHHLAVSRVKRTKSSDSIARVVRDGSKGSEPHTPNRERSSNCNSHCNVSPITDIDQAFRNSHGSADDLNNSLRRRSYRRAVAAEQESSERTRSSFGKESADRNGDVRRRSLSEGPLIIKPSSKRESHVFQHLLSSSSSSLSTRRNGDKDRSNQRVESQAWYGSEGNLSVRSSDGKYPSPVADNFTPKSSARSSSRASALALIDTLKGEESVDDLETCSVQSEPQTPRRQFRSTHRFLPGVSHVSRTPSGTSSSSSESGESWRSTESRPVGRINRPRKMPRTPSPESTRRNDTSSTSGKTPPRLCESESSSWLKYAPEHEMEVADLRRELQETKMTLASTHEQLILQESSTHKLVASIKERLAESEENLQILQKDKNNETSDLLKRLVNVENELHNEKQEMQLVIQAKQNIIDAQERRIKSLDSTNARLVATLNQLKTHNQC